jgi:NAD(P)-dependent dehydrogenase (short-subunit alcohol dehydrogenase family)
MQNRKQPRVQIAMATVLITGCDEGLGRGFAEAYAADGWNVLATYRDLANRWGEDGAIRHLPLDVTRPPDFLALKEMIGPTAIDLLIANAAIAIDRMRLGAIDYALAARMLEVNTLGPLRLVDTFVDNVAASNERKIILISSRMGSISCNLSGEWYAYRASKAGLNAIGRSLAIDLFKRGILVMLLHPGGVRTRGGGPRAALEVADSIAAMRKLIQRLGSHETGQFYNWEGVPLPW